MIAFYGMGLLGSNFVRALPSRNQPVRVWNRTPEKAAALAAEGAIPVTDPAEAAIARVMDHWLDKRHAHDDWTVLASEAIKS